ncbi:MAG: prefoldin subunit alpha [Candidatus Diapherotrites archaeon]
MAKKKESAEINAEEEKSKKKEIRLTFDQVLGMYQQNKQALESLISQEQLLNTIIAEIEASQDCMRELKAAEKDVNILVPLGAGVFAYAKIVDNTMVKLDIGANYFERMPILKAIERLEARKAQLRANLQEISKRRKQTIASLAQLERLINEAQRKIAEKSTPGVA